MQLTILDITPLNLPPKGDVFDFLEREGAEVTLNLLNSQKKHFQTSVSSTKNELKAREICEWLLEKKPVESPALDGIFDKGDKVAIIGPSKIRKSFFVTQLGIALATGIPFLNLTPSARLTVALIQFELKESRFHQRVMQMLNSLRIEHSELKKRFFVINGRGKDFDLDKLTTEIVSCKPDVIIFDPLYKMLSGDENSAQDMKPLLRFFDKIAEKTGAAVLYVHHDRKGSSSEMDIRDRGAGSGVLARDYDSCITLTAHIEGSDAVVIDFILRNYPTQNSFTAVWEEGKFIRSNTPPIVSTPKKRQARVSHQQALAFEDTALDILGEKGGRMQISEFRAILAARLTERGGRSLLHRLENQGKVFFRQEKIHDSKRKMVVLKT